MRCKQIAAMGMVGVLLGAGSLFATTGGASASGRDDGRARRAASRPIDDCVALVDERAAGERRPEDRGGRVHVARRHRVAHPGDASRRSRSGRSRVSW